VDVTGAGSCPMWTLVFAVCSRRKAGTRDASFNYNLLISSDLIQEVDKITETPRN
jgi:hypothetical protein